MVETQSSEIGGTGDVLIMKDSGERIAVFKYLKNNYAKEKERLILHESISICKTTQKYFGSVKDQSIRVAKVCQQILSLEAHELPQTSVFSLECVTIN